MKNYFLLFYALVLLFSCSDKHPESFIPESLGNINLNEKLSGEKAADIIGKLHGKDVAPVQGAIGYYGAGNPSATLYISKYSSSNQAQEILNDMSDEIGVGSSGFWHHHAFEASQTEIHMVLGHGQIHYFFAQDDLLYWLAADAQIAQQALARLLNVSASDIPPRN